ncbi:extracellular solute-binding protein, family 7 [Candidatus Vecturithrix granuli]|uniref:Extracellular solute-binding protein, family 7 n=1 Tax=Vecturithrix granuli TaxID=1499967 RepID=A0A081CA55_VECG1|nr:extracellular solute-binding protein, family 7 [Candidatus Vecturithrix granuli]
MRILRMVVITCVLVGVIWTGSTEISAAASDAQILKLAQAVYEAPSAHTDSVNRIAEAVAKRTDGRITFKVFGPELGDWTQINELVKIGGIDMALNPISTDDPRWNINFCPYIVATYEEARKVFGPGSVLVEEMYKTWAEENQVVWLGAWIQGFTGISLSTRPATTPEEAEGLKVRVPPMEVIECYWEALGFIPMAIPFSEVPQAIQMGVVDGQAGGGPFQTYSCCRDLNKYFVFYRDIVEIWAYTFNLEKWNAIDPEDQKIIQEVVNEEVLRRMDDARLEDEEYLQKLKDYGLTVVDLVDTPEKLDVAKTRARTCWGKMDEVVGKEWMDKLRAIVGESK